MAADSVTRVSFSGTAGFWDGRHRVQGRVPRRNRSSRRVARRRYRVASRDRPVSQREALNRTILLMRRDLRAEVPDDRLLDALLTTEVAFAADADNLASLDGQSALVGAVVLSARSGAQCNLDVPNVELLGVMSPLTGGLL